MKHMGTLIKLDPKQRHMLILDKRYVTPEQMMQIAQHGMKDDFILAVEHIDKAIKIVEYSEGELHLKVK